MQYSIGLNGVNREEDRLLTGASVVDKCEEIVWRVYRTIGSAVDWGEVGWLLNESKSLSKVA